MKIITVNRLANGRVAYIGGGSLVVDFIEQAQPLDNTFAEVALEAAKARTTEFAAAYLIDVENRRPSGRDRLREAIRQYGPTIYDFRRGAAA